MKREKEKWYIKLQRALARRPVHYFSIQKHHRARRTSYLWASNMTRRAHRGNGDTTGKMKGVGETRAFNDCPSRQLTRLRDDGLGDGVRVRDAAHAPPSAADRK